MGYHSNKTIPFVFETEVVNPVWTMISYGDKIYAGTGSTGDLLVSSDRFFWSKVYSVDDLHIRALFAQNNKLFIGSSPLGKIYIMDLNSNKVDFCQELEEDISSFMYYQKTMYAATKKYIYSYDSLKNKWDVEYQPYSSVNKMLIFSNKIYAILDNKNIISFDGNKWILETSLPDNISSIRSVETEPYSHLSNGFLNRNEIRDTSAFDVEDVYDVYPENYSSGLLSADSDGNNLIVGTSSYGKVYKFNGNLDLMFQAESSNTVYSILNVNDGVNLAAIDNALYLIYRKSDDTASTTTATTGTTTSTTTTEVPTVKVVYPVGGEHLVIGDTATIQWISSRSINDAVKIELWSGSIVYSVINPSTSNTGNYEWTITSDIVAGSLYRIVITWLSSGVTGEGTYASSESYFTIAATELATTTTTTVVGSDNSENKEVYNGISILNLNNDEHITCMIKDVSEGGILFSTSEGRILGCREAFVNSYLTGERRVFAEVKDGFGNSSDSTWADLFYALYNKVAEINSEKEVVKYKFVERPTAIISDRITSIFLSPILSVKEDLDFWKDLIWKEEKPDNTEIIICIRAADTVDELNALPWDYCFTSRDSDRNYGYTGSIVRNLFDYQIRGKYLQFKITMTTDAKDVTPSMLSLAITYTTKYAVYFFTTRFVLENKSDVKSGLIIANMTEPINTEIKFGVAGKNTSSWDDYSVVSLNKLFSLNNFDRLKIGIKMVSYDYNVPEVAEFAVLTGSTKINRINE